jgi:hypothetical protein
MDLSMKATGPSALLVVTALAIPVLAEAVLVRQGAKEIFGEPGIVPGLAIIVLGLLVLRFVQAVDALDPPLSGGWGPWVVLAGYIVVLYAMIPVGFQVVSFIVHRIGYRNFKMGINVLGAVVAIAFTVYLVRRHRADRPEAYIWLFGIVLIYLYYFWILEVPVKRVHFLEYSFLAVLVYRALRRRLAPPALYPLVTLCVAAVGTGEETIAVFLPKRFGAITDVIFDAAGGVLGLLVVKFVLREG